MCTPRGKKFYLKNVGIFLSGRQPYLQVGNKEEIQFLMKYTRIYFFVLFRFLKKKKYIEHLVDRWESLRMFNKSIDFNYDVLTQYTACQIHFIETGCAPSHMCTT